MPYPLPSPAPPPIVQVESDRAVTSSSPLITKLKSPERQQVTLDNPIPAQLRASKNAALLGAPISIGSLLPATTVAENNGNSERISTEIQNPPQSLETPQEKPILLGENVSNLETQASLTPENVEKLEVTQNIESAPSETPPTQSIEIPVETPSPPAIESAPVETIPTQSGENAPSNVAPVSNRIVELNADRQEYDVQRQIVTAEGNVILRLNGGVIDADSLQVNLSNRIAVGQGDVAVTRGEQVIRGERFTYNFVQNTGDLLNASGEIFVPSASQDLDLNLATDVSAGGVSANPPSDRLTANQPRQDVTNTGGIGVSVGAGRDINNSVPRQGGTVRRLRFQAQQVDFYPQGWQAQDIRITNDPFSPPELELRAETATLTRETPQRDRIVTTRQRLVFDGGLSIPIPRNQTVIDRSERDVSPGLFQVGLDGDERGGVFIERNFNVINSEQVQLDVTPQFFAQEALLESGGNVIDPDLYGLRSNLQVNLSQRASITGRASLTSLDLGELEDNLRASLRLNQAVDIAARPHQLNLEYSYRDRLFNGSLGYQTVQSSLGGVLTSPVIALGATGIALSYQAGAQLINADSDRADLLAVERDSDRISLGRLQASVALNRGFSLWQGVGLAATPTAGLRYTPAPVIPYVRLFTGLKGVSSFYSSGDSQNTLTGTIGVQGQFGHFSRRFLDYTGFNVNFSQDIRSGISPFLFDRSVDNQVLELGFVQQIYGPFRLGVQASFNLDTGENISTDYILEYSRRTYGATLRYNPVLALGSLSLRISDFNWSGGSNLFSDSEVKPVLNGVRQIND